MTSFYCATCSNIYFWFVSISSDVVVNLSNVLLHYITYLLVLRHCNNSIHYKKKKKKYKYTNKETVIVLWAFSDKTNNNEFLFDYREILMWPKIAVMNSKYAIWEVKQRAIVIYYNQMIDLFTSRGKFHYIIKNKTDSAEMEKFFTTWSWCIYTFFTLFISKSIQNSNIYTKDYSNYYNYCYI